MNATLWKNSCQINEAWHILLNVEEAGIIVSCLSFHFFTPSRPTFLLNPLQCQILCHTLRNWHCFELHVVHFLLRREFVCQFWCLKHFSRSVDLKQFIHTKEYNTAGWTDCVYMVDLNRVVYINRCIVLLSFAYVVLCTGLHGSKVASMMHVCYVLPSVSSVWNVWVHDCMCAEHYLPVCFFSVCPFFCNLLYIFLLLLILSCFGYSYMFMFDCM